MKRLRVFAIAAAIIAGCAGPSYKLNLKPYSLESVDFPMPSGLRILFQEDHSAPTVFVTELIGTGSTQEPPGKEGMAHLIEHLCFKARHNGKPEVWDEIRQLGVGDFNAFTAQDITQYHTAAPKEALISLLEIEANRLIDPVEGVTEDELKSEREVVRNELRLRIENGGGAAFGLVAEMLYPPEHPYHREVIGTHESLDNITLADVRAFTAKWYVPSNATIVVTGDFDRKDAGAIISKVFPRKLLDAPGSTATGKLALRPSPTPRLTGAGDEPPPPVEKAVKHIKGPVANPEVILAWSAPAGYRANQTLMEVVASTMANDLATELFPLDSRTADNDKIDGLGCFAQAQVLATTIYCFIDLTEGQDPEKIAKKALDGLVGIWDPDKVEGSDFSDGDSTYHIPGTRREFEAGRGGIEASRFRASVELGRAEPIAQFMHYTARTDYFTNSIQEASKLNVVNAIDFASKYLRRERSVTLIVEPYDKTEKQFSGVTIDASSSYAGATMGDAASRLVDFSRVTDDVIAATAMGYDVSHVKEMTLPNGLQVTIAKRGAQPFVSVGYYSKGGSETTTPYHLPEFAFFEAQSKDAGQIAGEMGAIRAGDRHIVQVDAPSGNLAAAIDLVHSRVTTTTSKGVWSKRRFDRVEEVVKRRTKTEEKRPQIWAQRALWGLLVPGSARGEQYDWAALEKVQAADVEAWWKALLAPKNSHLYVVGDLSLEEAEKLVATQWGTWREKDPGVPMPPLKVSEALPARQIALIDDQDATQTNVEVACHLQKRSPETDAALSVLSKMINQDLFNAIRKRNGASYGVYARFPDVGDTALMVVGGQIQNDKAIPGMRTILDRIKEIKDGKVDKTTLTETKWSLAGESHTNNQTNGDLLFELIALHNRGRSLETLSTYPKRLAAVSIKQISDILEPCAGHEVMALTGPAKLLQPGLESLKIPIEVVDWKKGADAKPDPANKTDTMKVETSKADPVASPTATPAATPAPKASPTPKPKKTK